MTVIQDFYRTVLIELDRQRVASGVHLPALDVYRREIQKALHAQGATS